MACINVLKAMLPAIEVHCFPFDCCLIVFFFCLCRSGLTLLHSELRTKNIRRDTWSAVSYNFYWLKTSSVIQSRTSRSRVKCAECPGYLAPLFQNESSRNNLTYKDEFDFHENESWGRTHFHLNGFAQRLVLTQRQNLTRKWLITISDCCQVLFNISQH